MQPEHEGPLAFMIAGQIAGKEGKQGNARHQYGRHQADEEIAGAEIFQEDLQEGGFDEDRKAEAPEEFHQGNGGCISSEQLIFSNDSVLEENRFFHAQLNKLADVPE